MRILHKFRLITKVWTFINSFRQITRTGWMLFWDYKFPDLSRLFPWPSHVFHDLRWNCLICIFQAVCQFFCEYLIILAQWAKIDQVTNYFKNLEVRYASYISKVSPQIALRSLLAAYGTQILTKLLQVQINSMYGHVRENQLVVKSST